MKVKLLLLIITVLLCVIIYKITFKDNTYLVALGDSSCLSTSLNGVPMTSYNDILYSNLKRSNKVKFYNNDYCRKSIKVNNLTEYINHNDNKRILNLLDKAKYVTLMIGFDELTSYKRVDNITIKDFLESYKELLKLINVNTKAKVFVIGFYPGYFEQVDYINRSIKMFCQQSNFIFIDPTSIANNKDHFLNENYHNLSLLGNEKIYDFIKEKM